MTDGALETARVEPKARAFICYSRVDLDFADHIVAALRERGFEGPIDRGDILPSEPWWQRIKDLIAQAHALVFVISPEAVSSQVCKDEVEFAVSLNKRLVPIVWRPVSWREVPQELNVPLWIFFNDPARFDASMDQLAKALETDIEWVRKHTEFGEDARRWDAAGRPGPGGLMLRPPRLDEAERWIVARPPSAPEPTEAIRSYISASRYTFAREMKRNRRIRAAIYLLLTGILVGLTGWLNEAAITERWRWWTVTRPFMRDRVRPYVRTAAAERALSPRQTFRECVAERDTDYCPEMIVIPAGFFVMGSSSTTASRSPEELPRHVVSIARPFTVSKFEVTFDEWDTCAQFGDCNPEISDSGKGRGKRPVINVSWYDAQQYVIWWSTMTGKSYRLLTEAEYEYAARAGTQTIYPWGNVVGVNNANCDGCGSRWDNLETAPAGSFAPNRFGLYDMVGNVWQWVEDCFHESYSDAPADGSAWLDGGNCDSRMVRGGSWGVAPDAIRSSNRNPSVAVGRGYNLSFRVARTLQ